MGRLVVNDDVVYMRMLERTRRVVEVSLGMFWLGEGYCCCHGCLILMIHIRVQRNI